MQSESDPDAILWRRLIPILVGGTALQIIVPLARLATTYKALEIDLSVAWIGVVSAAFSLLPVFLTVPIGRFNDRRGNGPTAIIGVIALLCPSVILMIAPPGVASFMVAMGVLGIGHATFASALQMAVTRCSGPRRRDSVVGHFSVAMSLGHALGPLVIAVGDAGGTHGLATRLLIACAVGAMVTGLAAAALIGQTPSSVRGDSGAVVPIATLARTRGLIWIILGGSLATASNDLFLIYLPVLGDERGIAAGVIGMMLSLRSFMAMASRLGFSRMAAMAGRVNLLTGMMLATGAAMVALFAPLPVWAMFLAMAVAGFSLGVAGPVSMSLTIQLAPEEARATALGLRMSGNRLLQFTIPLASGLLASVTGVAAIFVTMAALQATLSTMIRLRLKGVST